MFFSTEIRWFWKDRCPKHIDEWFYNSGLRPGGGDRVRINRYMQAKSQVDVGIKVRDFKDSIVPDMEIKGLLRQIDGSSLGFGPKSVELWVKWKVPFPLVQNGICVEKLRWLRKFDTSNHSPVEIELGSDERPIGNLIYPQTGCNIELTRVRMEDSLTNWWTLCFEAFGDMESCGVAFDLAPNFYPV